MTALPSREIDSLEDDSPATRHSLVFGATGFVGRHLVLALSKDNVPVTAAVRSDASYERLVAWLHERGCRAVPGALLVDFEAPQLGLGDPVGLERVTELYNCSGAFRFGMDDEEARHANVDSVRGIVSLASRLQRLRRIVHMSGYRVGGQDPSTVPWSTERRRRTYAQLGAYEASKVEADAVFQHEVRQAGLSWSIVNPCTVSGVASTGETDQFLGLADTLHQVWRGTLAARPGSASTFVPVVPVDYLAGFMARLPAVADSALQSYWVLDAATPPLPMLLDLVGDHYRVKVPRLRIPVPLLKRLPRSLTRADPETLSFLSSDRYPTASADTFARQQELPTLTTEASLLAWADSLAAQRFGAAAATPLRRAFRTYAGVRTFELGPADADQVVLPGLPVNADTWTGVIERLPAARAVDLPGLGMTAGGPDDWASWLDDLVASGPVRRLVGHSIGTAPALELAAQQPGRIDHLTLVAPFFLQEPPDQVARLTPLTRAYLRRVSSQRLATRLTGSQAHAANLDAAVADLRRGHAGHHNAQLLRKCGDRRWREALQQQLAAFPGTVHVVVGSQDPLPAWSREVLHPLGSRLTTTTIAGAGHHPQLTHPDLVAETLSAQ